MSPGVLDYNVILVAGDELVKNLAKNKVTKLIRNMVHPETAYAIFNPYAEKYMLAYGDDPADTRNNKVLVLDWNLQAFTVITGWQVNGFCQRANGDLLIATNGYILKANQGYKDWDPATGAYKAIDFHVKTKQYNLDYAFHIKQLWRYLLGARQYDAETSSIDITIKMDYKLYDLTALTLSSLSLDPSFTWGETWGLPWGWSDLITREEDVDCEGSRVQVEFQNTIIDEPVTIYGHAFEFKVRRAEGVTR